MKKLVNGVEVDMTQEEIDAMNQFWSNSLSIESYKAALEQYIDSKATERQYNNAVSIASYVDSTNPVWSAEAKAFVSWRDEAYSLAIATLEKVQSGEITQPTIEEFLGQLPAMEWPSD